MRSTFAQRAYAVWLLQNGYSGPRSRSVRGVGVVDPDRGSKAGNSTTFDAGSAEMRPRPSSRPESHEFGYSVTKIGDNGQSGVHGLDAKQWKVQ